MNATSPPLHQARQLGGITAICCTLLLTPLVHAAEKLNGGSSPVLNPPLPHPHWLENGLIDAGGTHEPEIFVIRRGGQSLDVHEQSQQAQSEALIRQLKESGVEVFHTHLYKGFGMAAEKPEMEETKRATALAHRAGLKVDTYIQWNCMMYESFFAEEPRAKNWIQRDASGKPILLTYGFQQSYRYRPCFSNQDYLKYLKKIVRYAVEEVKTDFIHFDNFDLNPEPDSCHCPACVQGFRNFLKAKYPPGTRKERFGFENLDYINPPLWNAQNPPQKMRIIYDPAIQEWIDYRCQEMASALRQMATYAKSLNPEVAIEINPHGITGGNRAWEAGLDHARLLKCTDAFWTEEETVPGYASDGRLLSRVRSYKLARRYDNILLAYIAEDPVALAEALAFNQTLGYLGSGALGPQTMKYLSFYRRHRDLYHHTEDLAPVAVLRSYPSITYNNAQAQLSAILVEQALLQSQIPFEFIFDEHLADLSKYKVVILPGSECLSDSQLASLRKFVEQGGGLLVTGESGLSDQWHRVRTRPGLEGLVDGQPRSAAYQETVAGENASVTIKPARKEFGAGRVIYFPSLPFDGRLPEHGAYFKIGERFWKRPANWADVVEGIRWAGKGSLPIEISGPPCLVVNAVTQRETQKTILHLVNYDRNKPITEPVKVICPLPSGQDVKEITVLSPDAPEPKTLQPQQEVRGISFALPEIKTYSVVVIPW